ncbi:hypothetical protein [Lactobacillus sp.]|uniref:hypothetical protein n=1 Tax=Lactobacillus sp. TaxID=1591 RepID=UPI0019BD5E72|nr:hypothetical protein [Lactobacillus sp.]MBD5430124.1 hypothetical protein [Lactobacillus sp.]
MTKDIDQLTSDFWNVVDESDFTQGLKLLNEIAEYNKESIYDEASHMLGIAIAEGSTLVMMSIVFGADAQFTEQDAREIASKRVKFCFGLYDKVCPRDELIDENAQAGNKFIIAAYENNKVDGLLAANRIAELHLGSLNKELAVLTEWGLYLNSSLIANFANNLSKELEEN